jgi:hypothetical protein
MSAKSLNDLPNELIIHIVSCVDLHRNQRIQGHIPDDPPPSSPDEYLIKDFVDYNKALCSLALTSRRFCGIAQEYLINAPVIGGCIFCLPSLQSVKQAETTPRIVLLMRTLFERPDLRRHVKQIRLCFPEEHSFLGWNDEGYQVGPEWFGKHDSHNQSGNSSDTADIICLSHKLVTSLDLPEEVEVAWNTQLFDSISYGVIGIILALLPKLEYLSFSEQTRFPMGDEEPDLYILGIWPEYFREDEMHSFDLWGIQSLPAASSLRILKVSSNFALCFGGLDLFPNLDTLDFAMKLAGGDTARVEEFERYFEEPAVAGDTTNFDRIQYLRIDCQVKTAGIWDFAARVSMGHVLRAFANLISLDFYAEPSDEKNPFRSVRAFPSSQINIQTYPDDPTPAELDEWSSVWDERVYDARTEWTDYQYLVDCLVHTRPRLRSLKLPGGFWTLPGATRKPLPSFTSFPELRVLVLPQAAILSIKLDSMHHAETEHNDFELRPVAVMPPEVQHLKIFDADADLLQSEWLKDLLGDGTCWPALHTVEILFGSTFDAEELYDLRARKTWYGFWTLADKASFQVLVGRDDDEVPSIGA